MVDYYDLLLAGIPIVLLAGLLLSIHPAVATYQGLATGSALATVFLVEALYRNPPAEPTRSGNAARYGVAAAWLVTVVLYL